MAVKELTLTMKNPLRNKIHVSRALSFHVCVFVLLFVCFFWAGDRRTWSSDCPAPTLFLSLSRRRPPHPLHAAPPTPYATPIAVSYSPPPTPFSLHLSLLSPEFRVTPTSAELIQTNAGKRTQTSTMYFCPDKEWMTQFACPRLLEFALVSR